MSQYFASLKPGDVLEVKGYYDMKIVLVFMYAAAFCHSSFL
jgi:hypothetical protein